MTTTIQPTVYELTLGCGHTQLATRRLPVGHGYPCWTACNPEEVTKQTVASVAIYKLKQGDAFIVASDVSSSDMLEIQKTVDLTNRSLADKK